MDGPNCAALGWQVGHLYGSRANAGSDMGEAEGQGHSFECVVLAKFMMEKWLLLGKPSEEANDVR